MTPKSARADLGGEPEVHFAGKRYGGRTAMIFDYSLAALVTAGLMIYLTYALLKPERF
jgi:K+-transporting ATPase KdpF subunit